MIEKDDISDEILMWKYVNGDYDAFERLYQRHSKKIYGYIFSKIKNTEESEEIYQTTFRKLHGSLNRYRKNLPFLPWVFTICKNSIIDNRRKKTNLANYQINSDRIEEYGESVFEIQKDSLSNIEGFDQLKSKEKKVLKLKYMQDFDFEQISSLLGYSKSNARKISSRAIEKLKNKRKKRATNE
jgi:RNA polymerase sigma factor (sigma-70 family)